MNPSSIKGKLVNPNHQRMKLNILFFSFYHGWSHPKHDVVFKLLNVFKKVQKIVKNNGHFIRILPYFRKKNHDPPKIQYFEMLLNICLWYFKDN